MKNKKFNTGLIVFIILIVAVVTLSVVFSVSKPVISVSRSSTVSSSSSVKTVEKGKSKNYIATVYIEGTIDTANATYNQNWLLTTIEKLKKDKNNIAIALVINSPGGGVYQSDEVYFALQDYKTSGKTVYAYMGPLAASGGYYISCAAQKIYANRNTLTGSIGVISGQTFDFTEMFENLGIKSETIHAGKNKNMGNYNEPLSDEQREILQSVADECYDQFVGIVANSRSMSIEEVEALADGRIYTAKQALENGLIDHIDSYANMIDKLKMETTGDETSVKEFRYQRKQSFMDMMLGTASKVTENQAAAKLGLPGKVIEDMNHFNSYPAYLYN